MTHEGISIYTGKYTAIRTKDGVIREIREYDSAPPAPALLSRGMTDLQVNGYRGTDYSGDSLTLEAVEGLVAALFEAGTFRHLPTLITSSFEQTKNNLALLSGWLLENPRLRSAIPGFHLEGPFISKEDGARGAHDRNHARNPSVKELQAWQQAARGQIRLITVAPELPGMAAFIQEARSMGIQVAIGHTLASDAQIQEAAAAGAALSTHLGNGSPALLPRLNNPIWSQLAQDNLSATLIADGFHLPAPVLKSMVRSKEIHRVMLVSDVSPMGGLPPGQYNWGSTLVEVHPDGHLGVAGTEYLAGAGHLLNRCVQFFKDVTGCSLKEALLAASDRPAAFLNQGLSTGPFRIGEPADVLCVEEGPEQVKVVSGGGGDTWVNLAKTVIVNVLNDSHSL